MQAQTSSFQSSSSTASAPQAATPSTVPPPPASTTTVDDGKLRRAVLSDPLILVAMRGVIRQRGVHQQDVEDVLNTVIADMMDDTKIPLDDRAQAKTYLCTCASFCSISQGRKRKRWSRIWADPKKKGDTDDKRDTEELAAPSSTSPETALMMERALREAQTKHPKAFDWWYRATIKGESQIEIAMDANVRPDHVRHEVAFVRNFLHGSTMVAMVALVFMMRSWVMPTEGPGGTFHHGRDLSSTRPVPTIAFTDTLPEATRLAGDLRQRAQQEYERGEWLEALGDLQEAGRVDPLGETPEMVRLQDTLNDKLRTYRAKP